MPVLLGSAQRLPHSLKHEPGLKRIFRVEAKLRLLFGWIAVNDQGEEKRHGILCTDSQLMTSHLCIGETWDTGSASHGAVLEPPHSDPTAADSKTAPKKWLSRGAKQTELRGR